VLTIVAIEATFEQRPPRVRLTDGTLGIPAHGIRPEVDIIWTAGDSSLPWLIVRMGMAQAAVMGRTATGEPEDFLTPALDAG